MLLATLISHHVVSKLNINLSKMREDGFGKRLEKEIKLFSEFVADDSTTDCKDSYGTVTDSKED